MAITNIDGSDIQAVATPLLKPDTATSNAEAQAVVSDEEHYQTELCGLELVFAEYIWSLIPAADSFDPDDKVSSRDINQAIYLIRLLREWAISHLTAYIHMAPVAHDPFFAEKPMPELVVEKEKDCRAVYVMPVGTYLQRFSERYGGVSYDPDLLSLTGELFKIGISDKPADEGAHFLMLPDPKELLRAASNNQPYVESSY